MNAGVSEGEGPEFPVMVSIGPVVANSRRVFFHPDHLDPAVARWGDLLADRSTWEHPCHYFDGGEGTARWVFVLDVLNHCFWPDRGEPVWTVTYRDRPYSGYWGLAAALKRAVEEGYPVTSAQFLSDLRSRDLQDILRGEGRIPLFDRRLSNLRETGRILEERWRGDVVHLVEASRKSAVRLVLEIASSFPSFRDQALHDGKTVYFWKRAQLFASDLHLAFRGAGLGEFEDISRLTAFADYKLPQVLRELGVISYDPHLASLVDGKENLDSGSAEEVEIRAMTLHAVEELRKAFLRAGRKATRAAIDNWLWQLGQLEPFRRRPYHRCRTIFY